METEPHRNGRWRLVFPSLPLAQRILLWVVPLALSGIFASTFPLYRAARKQILKDVREEMDGSASGLARNLRTYLDQRLRDLDGVSESPLLEDHYKNREYGLIEEAEAYRREVESYLLTFLDRTRAFHAILYLDSEGATVARALAEESDFVPNWADPDVFRALRALPPGRSYRSEIAAAGVPPRPVWIIGKPIHDAAREFRGAIIMVADLTVVEDALSRRRPGENGSAALVARSGDALIGTALPAGDGTWVSVRPVAGTEWSIRTTARLEDFIGSLEHIRRLTFGLTSSCALMVLILLCFQVRSLTAPIKSLVEAARRYGEGDLSHRVPVRGSREIAGLARQFNLMASRNRELFDSIRRSEERYRSVVDGSVDAIIGLGAKLRVTVWNRGARDIFGFSKEEMLGSSIERLFLPEEYARLLRMAFAKGPLANFEIRGKTREGKALSLSLAWAGSGDGVREDREWALVIRDVTSEKILRSHLIEVEKLSLTGKLLSGVAHELNNPLTNVIGYSEILKNSLNWKKLPSRLREDLDQIATNARQCAAIVDNLLVFVRRPRVKKKRFSLPKAVRESVKLLEHNLKRMERIRVSIHMEKKLAHVTGSIQQIEQVFVNIIQNACRAMASESDEKRLEISVRREGNRALVEIDDSGPGIPEAERARVFEPFFTTREDGTGLGLAICSQIIRDHGGTIECGDSPLGGALFRIRLPFSSGEVKRERTERPPPKTSRKRILVVEDDPGTLALINRFLLLDKHSVSVVRSGQAALKHLSAGRFDLVISDLHLSRMDGRSILETASRRKNPPALLLVTGDIAKENPLRGGPSASIPVLRKPFTLRVFQKAVQKALQCGKRSKLR